LDMDQKIIEAGMFNNKAKGHERHSFLLSLLHEDKEEEKVNQVPNNQELNRMLARTDQEFEIFEKMDTERDQREIDDWIAAGNTGPHPPRLMTEEELPEWLTEDVVAQMERVNAANQYGRGHRARSGVKYADDNMTELEFMEMIENNETLNDSRKKRSRAAEAEQEVEEEATPDDYGYDDHINDEEDVEQYAQDLPKAQRSRSHTANTPSFVPAPGKKRKPEPLLPDVDFTHEQYLLVWTLIRNARDFSVDRGRYRCEDLIEKPDPSLFPDYFEAITYPISLTDIYNKLNLKEGSYTSPQEYYNDFIAVFENAKAYYGPGSSISHDAEVLQKTFDDEFKSRFTPTGVKSKKRR